MTKAPSAATNYPRSSHEDSDEVDAKNDSSGDDPVETTRMATSHRR